MGTVHHVLGTRTIHGDLVTEHFNKETKGTAGPFPVGSVVLVSLLLTLNIFHNLF